MSRLRTACLVLATTTLAACASTAPRTAAPTSLQVDVPTITHPDGETAAWWFRDGAAQAAQRGAMAGNAKNVILFVGDGMSLPTVAAARIFAGQQNGQPGEHHRLSWERFPATALSKTYNTDSQTPDSAGTMSAMATGAKTRMGVLSVGQAAPRGDCAAGRDAQLLTLWELAESAGLATGLVSTARLTHATPGATFSHVADRDWENDTELSDAARAAGCMDVARQIIETPFGDGPEVLLGGGRRNFMLASQTDPEYPDRHGEREDGRDLIAAWQQQHPNGAYVWNAQQLAAAPADAELFGLFEPSHMQFEHDRDEAAEPSLAQLTRAAISRLESDSDGYVLLVEGGRIDHAHHAGNAYRALVDTVALSEAVATAAEMTSADDTLILVTADHAHTLSFVGYPVRGNPILGKVRAVNDEGELELARDALGQPYTTLSYSNGPGYTGASKAQPEGPKQFPHYGEDYQPAIGRPDLTDVDTTAPDYMQEALVPKSSESHGGDDVGIWARGPGSAAVRGSVEQNAIFHFLLQATPALRQALCDADDCNAAGVPVELPEPADFK